MTDDDKFVMRSGGFVIVFFGALIVLCLYCLGLGLRDGPGHDSLTSYYLCLVMFAGFPAYLLYFLLVQRVELTHSRLFVRYIFKSYGSVEWTVYLSDISEVMLATIGQIKRNHPELAETRNLQKLIHQYETSGRGVSLKMAAQFTPLIVIRTKNIEDTNAIITKPFSRRRCRALMAALRKRGVKVTGDEKL